MRREVCKLAKENDDLREKLENSVSENMRLKERLREGAVEAYDKNNEIKRLEKLLEKSEDKASREISNLQHELLLAENSVEALVSESDEIKKQTDTAMEMSEATRRESEQKQVIVDKMSFIFKKMFTSSVEYALRHASELLVHDDTTGVVCMDESRMDMCEIARSLMLSMREDDVLLT